MNNKQQKKKPLTKAAKSLKQRKPKSNGEGSLKTAPVAKARTRRIPEARFKRSLHNGDITVEHEELIADINGSQLFQVTGYSINPGMGLTFPWLSQAAPLYESYKLEKLEFVFQSSAPTSATGTVMMAIDYDASDPLASTKQQLATYRGFVRSAPWEECTCISIQEDLNKLPTHFIRTGPLPANSDIKLYDVGTLNFAVQGQADTSPVGELYIRYRVKLMTPQLNVTGTGLALYGNATAASLAAAPVQAGNMPVLISGTGAALTLTALAPYQCLVSFLCGGTTITDVTGSGTATFTQISADTINSAGTQCQADWIVSMSPNQTFTITTTAATGTIAVRVGQYGYALG